MDWLKLRKPDIKAVHKPFPLNQKLRVYGIACAIKSQKREKEGYM